MADTQTSQVPDHDHNQVLLVGTLTTAPEHRIFGTSGASLAQLLVTVRLSQPRTRTDVIPVTVWDPEEQTLNAQRGTKVQVSGQVHRRFWTDAEGRHSRIEVVADQISMA